MYKLSRYNYNLTFGKQRIVYNIRTQNIIAENEDGFEVLWKKDLKVSEEKILQRLLSLGFIILEKDDELKCVLDDRYRKLSDRSVYKLLVIMSYNCNLACKYCYQHDKKGNTNLSVETIEAIKKHVRKHYLQNRFERLDLRLYGGEPTCNMKGCVKLIEYIKELREELGFRLFVHITTNGTNVTDEFTAVLKDVNVRFQITIDGAKELHDSKRIYQNGTGSYDRIIGNIHRLYDELPLSKFCLRVNFDNDVIDSIPYLLPDILPFKVRSYVLLHKIFQVPVSSIDAHKLDAMIALLNRCGIVVGCNLYYVGICCAATYINFNMINYNGIVKRCSGMLQGEGNKGILTPQGNIAVNYDPQKIISNVPDKCLDCRLLPMCGGPCYKRLEAPEKECDYYAFPIEKILKFNIKQKLVSQNVRQKHNRVL